MIFICNPNNPTGTMIREEDFISFMEQVPRILLSYMTKPIGNL